MLSALAPFGDDGALRVVVESPRHSTLKYKFDPKLDAITVARQLALGLAYPYDWGFVPGTRAPDGDPADALVMHSAATYPVTGWRGPRAALEFVRDCARER